MNLMYALYVLGLIGLCTCNSSPENALSKNTQRKNDGFTLDLMSPDKTKIFTSEANINGVFYQTFIAIVEETIVKVVHSDKTVWEADPERGADIVRLYSKGGNAHLIEIFRGIKANYSPLFFAKNRQGWEEIPEKDFWYRLDALYDEVLPSKNASGFTLDLTHPNRRKVFTSEATIGDATYKTFVAIVEETISKVLYDDKVVWEAGPEGNVTVVRLLSRGGYPHLVEVLGGANPGYTPLFFEHRNGNWLSVNQEEYDKAHDKLFSDEALFSKKTSITLDLASPDQTKGFTSETDMSGVTYKTFYAYVQESVSKVLYDGKPVWEAAPEGNVTVVRLFSKGNIAYLIEIFRGIKSNYTPLFFERRSGEWKSIPEHEFSTKLNALYDNKSGTGFTLDLMSPDQTKVFTSEATLGGVVYNVFYANVKESISKIVHSDKTVWKVGTGTRASVVRLLSKGSNARLISVEVGVKGESVSYFFEHQANKWVSVGRDYYYKAYDKLFSDEAVSSKKNAPGFTLDLANVDRTKVSVVDTDYNNLHNTVIWTNVGFSISKVVHQGRTVWESHGFHAPAVNVLYIYGMPRLLRVLTGPNDDKSHSFERVGDEWVSVSRDHYYKAYDGLFSEQTKFGFTVNLSNPDVSKVAIYEHNVNGVKYEHMIPKHALHADHVVDNGTSLWVSESGSRVTGIVKYSSYGRSICRLNIVDAKNKLTQQYFLKKDGQWKNIDFSTFFDKAKELVDTAAKEVKVDVLSPLPGITNTVYNDYGVETRRISPLNGFKIVSLHYGKELLWEGKNGEYCSSATFFEKDGVEIASVMVNDQEFFFEHADGSWVGTDAKTFQDSYLKMMGVVTPEPVKEVKVDVLSPLPGVTNVVYNYYGIETRRVSPVGDFKIVSLHYGKELLWEGATGQYLSSATFFEKDGVEIASLMTSEKEIFFEHADGSWVGTDDKRFSEVYLKMMGVVTPEPAENVDGTLDIAALPQETETYKPSEDSPYTFFVVSTGTPVIRVVDGPDTIWTGTNEQLCTASSFLFNGKKTLLAQIVVEGLVETNVLYFEKRTFKWHQITEALYDFKLEQLKVLKDGFLTNSLYTITLFVAIVSGITLL